MVIGTPNYMSPEQVRGELVDHRSDIFAVGLVLYELLVYRRAFEADSQTAVLMKILTESPPTLLSLDPLLDPAIAELVERALAKDPAKRPPDLASLRTELTRLLYRLESMGPDDRTIIVPRPSQKGGGPATPPPLPDAASLLRDARSRLEAGALTEASALVARAAELDPSSGDVGPMRLAIEQAAAERERLRERARRVSAALKQAREALDAGALDSATRAVSEALSLNPDDRGALALRSEIQQRSARAAQPPPPIPPSAVTPPPPPPPTPIPAAIEPAARQLEAPARIGPTRRVPLAFLAAAAVALLMVVIVGVLAWRQFSAWQARRATLPPVATKPAATAPSPVAEPPKVVTPAPATPPAGETAAPDPNALISARLAEAVRLFDENTTGAALDDLGELLEEAPQREDLRETALRWARVLQLRAQQARASVARPTRGTWPPAMRNANQTLRRGELQLQNGEGLAAARTLERARTEWQRIGDQAAARSAAREASPGTRRVESAPSPGPPRSEPTPAEPAPAVEPAAPAAREPARQPAGEEDPVHAAINRTLASFERAFESRSAESLRPIWPSLSSGAVQAYQAQFSRVLFQQWTFNSREIRVGPNGNRATAQCSVTVSFLEPGSRDTRVEQRTVRFELERLGPIWVIASVSGV
jgi:tetratricopeptide (TPR) repeat protein